MKKISLKSFKDRGKFFFLSFLNLNGESVQILVSRKTQNCRLVKNDILQEKE